jgi:hypothetical protein
MARGASSRAGFLRCLSGGGGASSDVGCRSLLSLRLGVEVFFSDASVVCVRFVASFSAFRKDFVPLLGVACAAVVAEDSGLSSSSWSRMVVLECFFPCHRRSGNDRRSFITLSSTWLVHGVESYGVSKVWGCASVLASGLLPGFVVQCSSGLLRRCIQWRRLLVKLRDLGWGCIVICFVPRVSFIKRVCSVLRAI